MFKVNFQKGYVALFSTIILSAVFLLLLAGMFLVAMGGMSRVSNQESSLKSFALAEKCKESALADLRVDTESIIDNIAMGGVGDSCYIDEVVRHNSMLVSFSSIGEYQDFRKIIQIDLDIQESEGWRTLNIINWSEDVN